MMYTGKVDHRFSDKVSLAGFYLYNKTDEPCANYLDPGLNEPEPVHRPRRLHPAAPRARSLALNNTWLPSNNTVLTFRYGWTKFQRRQHAVDRLRPGHAGLQRAFRSALQTQEVPAGRHSPTTTRSARSTRQIATGTRGAPTAPCRNWSAATPSRWAWTTAPSAIETQSFSGGAGRFDFDRLLHVVEPAQRVNGATPSGNALASLLLGYPSGDPGNQSRILVSSPRELLRCTTTAPTSRTTGASARSSRLNYGLRIEHEDGLREEENGFTVAFDRTLNPGGALGASSTASRSRRPRVCRRRTAPPTYQGNPPAAKFSPRVGMVYSINPKTVLRGGYGIYWAPWNYQAIGSANYGNVGFTQQHVHQPGRSSCRPTSLTNPFPNGVSQPSGNRVAR